MEAVTFSRRWCWGRPLGRGASVLVGWDRQPGLPLPTPQEPPPPFQLFRDGQALILPNPLLDQNPPKNLGGRLLERRMGLAGMTGLLHVVLSACPGVSSFSLRGPDSLGRPCPHPIHTLTKRRPCRKIVGTAPRQLPAPGMRLSWENPWLLPKALPRGKAPPWAR